MNPDSSQKTCELLSKFMISQGLPLANIRNSAFQDLLEHFEQPDFEIPTENCLEDSLKWAEPETMDCKVGGALSITVDLAAEEDGTDEKWIVFSCHHFEDFHKRTAIVHFEKLEIAQFNWPTLWSRIHVAITAAYTNFHTVNIVCSSPELAEIFRQPSESRNSEDVRRNDYICFAFYVDKFARQILEIDEVKKSINRLHRFLKVLKTVPEIYRFFVEFQKSKNWDPKLPTIDSKCWQSELFLFTRCLEMDPIFLQISQRWSLVSNYITSSEFNNLLYIQKVLDECEQCLQNLGTSNSSMSQVIPAISRIQMTTMNSKFDDAESLNPTIQTLFSDVFCEFNGSEDYQKSTWLNPRFAFRRDIQPVEKWDDVTQKILEGSSDGVKIEFQQEIQKYRKLLKSERPAPSESPFIWWVLHQERLPNLANLAHRFLAVPAVSIDSAHFFGPSGKFSHVSRIYRDSGTSGDRWMRFAARHQEFRGRGTRMPYKAEGFARPLLDFKAEQSRKRRASSPSGDINLSIFEPKTQGKTVQDYLMIKRRNIVKWQPNNDYKSSSTLYTTLQNTFRASEEPEGVTTPLDDVFKDVKLEQPEEIKVGGVEEDIWNPHTWMGSEKKKQCNRRCCLCNQMKLHEEVKNVTIIGEKLLMALIAFHTGRTSENHARDVYNREKKSFFCREHYGETAGGILNFLKIQNSAKLADCSMEPLQGACNAITNGRVDLADNNLRAFMINFVQKNEEKSPIPFYKPSENQNQSESGDN